MMAWGAFGVAAFAVVVRGAWESLLLAGAAALVLRVWPRSGARSRCMALLLAFAGAAVLPAMPLLLRAGSESSSGATPLLRVPGALVACVLAAWALASAWQVARLGLGCAGLLALRRSAVAVRAGARVEALLTQGPRPAALCTSDEVDVPCVLGFVRPRLLIPTRLLAVLSEEELAQIVLHEREHLRHYDDWWNALGKVALALLPLNPALWWLDGRLGRERELACDAGAVAGATPYMYAATLTRLAEERLSAGRGARRALLMAAWRRRTELAVRVEAVLQGRTGTSARQSRWALCSAGVLVVLLGGVALHAPQVVGVAAPRAGVAASAPVDAARMGVPLTAGGGANHARAVRAVLEPPAARAAAVVYRPDGERRVLPVLRRAVRAYPAREKNGVSAAVPQQTAFAQRRRATATPRAVLIEFRSPYAAVPFGNGWLIFQL